MVTTGVRMMAASVVLVLTGACTEGAPPQRAEPLSPLTPSVVVEASPTPTNPADDEPLNRWVTRRPEWLGTRVLPRGPSGFGIARPTPPLLRNRRLPTIDLFAAHEGRRFTADIGPVPPRVAQRSTWRPRCPVTLDELAYIRMTFWGFDHRRHTGEMITNESVAEGIVDVFRTLYQARFPIEEMRVVTLREQWEWKTKPTGDMNVTSSLECRKATLGSSWSQHAYGLAVDLNPFHNPYVAGELIAPELAGAYANRSWRRPGMIFEGDVVTRAFDALGWGWGGRWSPTKDWMHFSQSGH